MSDKPKSTLGEELADKVAVEAARADDVEMAPNQPEVEGVRTDVEIETKLLKEEEAFVAWQEGLINTSIIEMSDDSQRVSDLIERTDDEERIKALPRNLLIFQQTLGIKPYFVPKKAGDPKAIAAIFEFAPVRPSRFPDKLYEDLIGDKLSTNKKTKGGMQERMDYPVDYLRKTLGNMAELKKAKDDKDPRDWTGRLQVVSRVSKFQRVQNKRGAILTSSTRKYRPGVANDESFEGGEKSHYSLFGNLDSLIRSHLHTKNFYTSKETIKNPEKESELSTLAHLKDAIQTIIGEIQKWKGKTPEEREALSDTIRQLRKHVTACTNQYKVEVDRLLLASWRMEDSSGKTNPGAKAAQIVKALNQDLERFRDAVSIEHTINRDYESLRCLEEELNRPFFEAVNLLEEITEGLYFNLGSFTKDNESGDEAITLADEVNEDILNSGVIRKLQAMVDDDGCPAPYPQLAEAILTNLRAYMTMNERISQISTDELHTKLGYSDLELVHREACQFVINAQIATRYITVNDKLNEVLGQILIRPFDLKPGYLFEDLDGAHQELNPKIKGEDFDIKGGSRRIVFEDPNFTPTSNFLGDLKRLVQIWAQNRMFSRDKRDDLINRYRDGLLSISREELEAELESLEEGMCAADREFLGRIREQGRDFDLAKIAQSMVVLPENAAYSKLAGFDLYRKDGEFTAAGT